MEYASNYLTIENVLPLKMETFFEIHKLKKRKNFV